MSDFNWQLVPTFLAAHEHGSLLGAARALGLSQPTVGRHVAQLESQLGTPLFERTGRGLVATPAAHRLADAARAMEAGAQSLLRGAHQSQTVLSGSVRLSASQPLACVLMPTLLLRLRAELPGIQIELVVSNAISDLLRREADIAVRMVRPAQSSLVARKIGEIGIGAYAHASYLARAGVPRSPDELLSHRLVGMDTDDTLTRGFAGMGIAIARERFVVRTDDHLAYGRLVAAGAGIGFLAHYHAAQTPGLQRLLPQLRIPALPCWLAVHREIRSSRVVRRVYDHLARALAAQLGSDNGQAPTAPAANLL